MRREHPLNFNPECDRLLFVTPHDDDAIIGAGLTLATALQKGVAVKVAIVTDGSMGYCSQSDRDTIVGTRWCETIAGYGSLGLKEENLFPLGFPDGQTRQYQGRRLATRPRDPEIAGYTGMQNSLTRLFRIIRPTHVFTTAQSDIHPDHKAVEEEVRISIFHAASAIWGELGPSCEKPELFTWGTYPLLPRRKVNLTVRAPQELFEKKLDALSHYKSQGQIAQLIEEIRGIGPIEVFAR